MKRSLIKSAVFHIAIFLITIIGFPLIHKEPVIVAPVSVELVNIDELTRTDHIAPPRKKAEKPKEAPKPPPEKPKPIEKPAEPKPPPPEEKPKEPDVAELEKPKPEEKKPEPKPEEKPPEPKKEEPKKAPEKPKPEPKKEEPKKDEKKEEADFNSLLKNLTPDKPVEEQAPTEEEPKKDAEPDSGQIAELSDRLSVSELDAFRHQIEPCWNVPAGAEYAENLSVEIRVTMRRDMTVEDARVLDQGRYNSDTTFRAAADSALRALRNPRCSPLKLPPEKYDEWKSIVINFDPGSML